MLGVAELKACEWGIHAVPAEVEANKALVLGYFLASHNAPFDLDVVDEVCTPAYATQQREWHEMERAAFPDKHFDVEGVVTEGDKVVIRWHFRGTHRGLFWTPLGTVPATGRTLDLRATLTYRIENGKIAEEIAAIDWLTVVQQLGAECTFPRRM
jgi:steroid delta-isomerase-like uncharacterized protein